MTSEERRLLVDFLGQLEQVRGFSKDAEAESLIAQTQRRQPDALYLLVQKALLQTRGLEAAQARIAELESRSSQGRGQGFLGADPWAAPNRFSGSSTPFGASAFPASPGSSGMGGFLGTALATAAGIAGGAFLVQGIESLLGHHGGGWSGGDSLPPEPVENVTINEYYLDDEDTSDAGRAEYDPSDADYDEYGDDEVSV